MSDLRDKQLAGAHAIVELLSRDLPLLWRWDIREEGVTGQLNTVEDATAIADLQEWATFLGGADGPSHISHEAYPPPSESTRAWVTGQHCDVRVEIWTGVASAEPEATS